MASSSSTTRSVTHRLALAAGRVVGNYRIESVLGHGGFGITYLAHHTGLDRRVALKELLPVDFATRDETGRVVPLSPEYQGDMDWARDRFLGEARNLSRCEHPNILRVFDVVETNGTVYMPTSYEEGQTLSQWLTDLGRTPTEAEVLGIINPLLDGLERVHKEKLLHRDIKPDNIYICNDGRPVLLDFGAAREAVVSRSRPVTSLVSAGYTPLEQYSSEDAANAGPATDLYALGGTVYRMLTGEKPPEATRRLSRTTRDPYQPLSLRLDGRYSAGLLSAIDQCLEVMDTDRPQSVAELRTAIAQKPLTSAPAAASKPPPLPKAATPPPAASAPAASAPPPLKKPTTRNSAPTPPKTIPEASPVIAPVVTRRFTAEAVDSKALRPPGSNRAVFIVLGLLAAVLAIWGGMQLPGLLFGGGKGKGPSGGPNSPPQSPASITPDQIYEAWKSVHQAKSAQALADAKALFTSLATDGSSPRAYEGTAGLAALSSVEEGGAPWPVTKRWRVTDQPVISGYDYVDSESGKWGYIDEQGQLAISISQPHARWFSEGLASFSDSDYDGSTGFINDSGRTVITAEWRDAMQFNEGLSSFRKSGSGYERGCLNHNGKVVFQPEYEGVYACREGFFTFRTKVGDVEKSGFLDRQGKVVLPAQWEAVGAFSEGLALVKTGGKWGCIDRSGRQVVPAIYEEAFPFSQGLARVKMGDKWGFMGRDALLALPCQWEDCSSFSDGYAVVKESGKYGVIDRAGNLVVPCKWQSATAFFSGFSAIEDDNHKWGFMDTSGRVVIPCVWDHANVFFEGLALVAELLGPRPAPKSLEKAPVRMCYINTQGRIIWSSDGKGTGSMSPVGDYISKPSLPPADATLKGPYENSLGMRFVPISIPTGPSAGKKVLFSIWETRVKDYAAYASAEGVRAQSPDFTQNSLHPVVMVSWQDAKQFIAWLNRTERAAGRLPPNMEYRLPTDHEWSCAVGIAANENAYDSPSKNEFSTSTYPWGTSFPPPRGTGNFSFDEINDGYAGTAPVGTFPPNSLGLYDLSGNANEWVEDYYTPENKLRLLRGGSWLDNGQTLLQSATRHQAPPDKRDQEYGFRCVLAEATSSGTGSAPPSSGGSSFKGSSGKGSPLSATASSPFENSLGMSFVPVPVGSGSSGQPTLFSIYETRVSDFKPFAQAKSITLDTPEFRQTADHPAVRITWSQATAFCKWLTDKERASGRLPSGWSYRLPTDYEWSCAVGCNGPESKYKTPKENEFSSKTYPWGTSFPPPSGFGNFRFKDSLDPYEGTSPVGTYAPNTYGLYDLSGNASEWVQDLYTQNGSDHVLRGGSWLDNGETLLQSATRNDANPDEVNSEHGFRCVLSRDTSP